MHQGGMDPFLVHLDLLRHSEEFLRSGLHKPSASAAKCTADCQRGSLHQSRSRLTSSASQPTGLSRQGA